MHVWVVSKNVDDVWNNMMVCLDDTNVEKIPYIDSTWKLIDSSLDPRYYLYQKDNEHVMIERFEVFKF
jgi:hypothetical protein